jgi:hypothetical protein
MGDPDLKQVRSGYARGQEAAGERGQARISVASRNNWDRSPFRLADRTPNEFYCPSERALGKLIRFVTCDGGEALVAVTKLDGEGIQASEVDMLNRLWLSELIFASIQPCGNLFQSVRSSQVRIAYLS